MTGGQDAVVNRWKVDESAEGTVLSSAAPPLHHSYWVTAVSSLAPDCHPMYPDGLVVCGTRDNVILLYDMQGNLLHSLSGHEKPPVSFSWTKDYNLVSGSWDGTARLWDISSCLNILTFGGHENAVNVLCLTENETVQQNVLATVSTGESVNSKPANFRLRYWSLTTGQLIRAPIEDHAGSIRSIFRIPGAGFATTSNDGSVQVRRSADSDDNVNTFLHPPQVGGDGFPAFVLGGCAVDLSHLTSNPLETVGFVSCGEDGSVVVWKGGEMEQVIHHPSSVWGVCTIPASGSHAFSCGSGGWFGSDIATAGHDGMLRIFSCDAERTSNPLALALQDDFEKDVKSAQAKLNKGPSEEDLAKAPKWENRYSIPGSSEGQVRVFNKDGIAIAAQWSDDSNAWIEIGEVTGSNRGDGGEVNGVKYDHVMPVEIETATGVVTLQLGYDDLENPFVAAQRFIDQNQIDQNHLKQIADFISDRAGKTSQPTFDMGSATEISTTDSTASTSNKRARYNYTLFPIRGYFSFEDVLVGLESKFMKKINEFNSSHTGSGEGCLSEAELHAIECSLSVLSDTSHYHSSKLPNNIFSALNTMLSQWTDSKSLFPSFDLLRMISAHPSGAQQLASSPNLYSFIVKCLEVICTDFAGTTSQDCEFSDSFCPSSSPQTLTALRFMVNCFRHNTLRKKFLVSLFSSCQEGVFGSFFALMKSIHSIPTIKVTHRHALCTFCVNVALSYCGVEDESVLADVQSDALSVYVSAVISLLEKEKDNGDIVLRCLFALGSIALNKASRDDALKEVLKLHCVEGLLRKVEEYWRGKLNESFDKCIMEVTHAIQDCGEN